MNHDADVIVVGAGAVGLACAQALAVRGRGNGVFVLERHDRFGVETSSRNSEVIHAGIYYTPGSLKATLCVGGNPALYRWCADHDVPHRRLGKLLVATTTAEETQLASLEARARANGVCRLHAITPARARELEPHLRCTAALWSPDTGIIDSHGLMRSFIAALESAGGTIVYRHTVIGAECLAGGGYRIVARDDAGEETTLTCRQLVNSAGLDADRVAGLPGLDVDAAGYRLHYARGHYFRVAASKQHLARHLLYPTPVDAGLGIHVTLDLGGGLKLGPDVQYLPERTQDYAVAPELARTFCSAASRYLDGLEEGDLSPDQAGIRPKLQGPGEPVRDFVIAEESARGLPGWVNLVGIESPGLTCALEIAGMVVSLLGHA